jgi:hypothetical protein
MQNEKAFILLKRNDGEDLNTFRDRYLKKHTVAVVNNKNIQRYNANVVEEIPSILTPESGFGNPGSGVDAVDEIWCDEKDIPISFYENNFNVVGIYAINERIFIDYKPDWKVGEKSRWMKRINFLKRRPDITHEQFEHHWRTVHGPMGAKVHQVPKYVQNLLTPLTSYTELWDGSVQMHFWSPEEFVRGFFPDEESKAMVLKDVGNFIGDWGGGRPAFLLSEYMLKV